MTTYLLLFCSALRAVLRSRQHLVLENLALRQQLAVLSRQSRRPRLEPRAGYLAAFAALGYHYIMRASLDVVRQQLANPHDEVLRVFSVTASGRISREERRLLLVRRPRWLNSVAVHMGRHIVFLPSPEGAPRLYESLAQKADQQARQRLDGKLIPWPTKPEYALDFL